MAKEKPRDPAPRRLSASSWRRRLNGGARFNGFELSEGGRLPDEASPPGPALRGSNAPLVGLFELRGDELLGPKRLGLPAPVVPLLPQLVAIQLDISEHHLDARQLGFGGR